MNLYKFLIECQEIIKPFKKDKKGQVGYRDYKYTELPTILETIKPILKKEGIGILVKTSPACFGDKVGNIQTVVLFDEEGNKEESSMFIELQPDPQSTGIWKTYFRRYSIGDLFNLSTEEDTDGDLGTGENSFTQKQDKKEYPKAKWPYGTEMTDEMKKAYWAPTGDPKTFKELHGCEPYKIGFKYYIAPIGTFDKYKKNPNLQAYTLESLRGLNYEGMSPEEKEKFDKENNF